MQNKQGEELLTRGYTVIDVLSTEEASKMADMAFKRVFNVCFGGRSMGNTQMLTESKQRGIVFNNKNHSRMDIFMYGFHNKHLVYDKNTGLVDSFLSPFGVSLHLNENATTQVAGLYAYSNTHKLTADGLPAPTSVEQDGVPPVAYLYGPECFGMKVVDCPESAITLDCTTNYPDDAGKVQGTTTLFTHVCLSVDQKCSEQNSGCLEVLENAHLYHDILTLLMRDQRLFAKEDIARLIFHDVPDRLFFERWEPRMEVDERFDAVLDWFNEQLAVYTSIYNAAIRGEGTGTDEELREEMVRVLDVYINTNKQMPWCPREFQPLKWKSVRVKPGQAVVFDSRLLYRTNAVGTTNKKKNGTASIKPYIYQPLSLRVVPHDYYLSPLHGEVRSELADATISLRGTHDHGMYTMSEKEVHWMRSTTEVEESIRHYAETISNFTDREKLLFCIKPYPGLRIHPSRRPV